MHPPPPDFPTATEARVKHASIVLLLLLRRRMADMVRPYGRVLGANHAQLVADVAAAGRDAGRYLRSQSYRFLISQQAERAARKMATYAAAIVGRHVAMATERPELFVEAAWERAEQEMDGLAEAMAAAFGLWLAGDDAPLHAAMQQAFDRSAARWVQWLGLMAGWLAGGIAAETYRAAGVTEAVWVSRDDRRVRPAHHALNGVRFSYDGDAPLSAAVSSSGEDCWPGDDYNCRCVGVPIVSRRSSRPSHPTPQRLPQRL